MNGGTCDLEMICMDIVNIQRLSPLDGNVSSHMKSDKEVQLANTNVCMRFRGSVGTVRGDTGTRERTVHIQRPPVANAVVTAVMVVVEITTRHATNVETTLISIPTAGGSIHRRYLNG